MLTDHLPDIARYCKVDTEDPELSGFVATAQANLAGAGVSEPEADTPRFAQYLQAVKYMVLDMYDQREGIVAGTVSDNPAFRGLINQLKITEPVPESGTGSGE